MKTIEEVNKAIQDGFKKKHKTGLTPDGKKISNKDIVAEFIIGGMIQNKLGYYNTFVCTMGNLMGELKLWETIDSPVDRMIMFYWMNPKDWNEAVSFVRRDILLCESEQELDEIVSEIKDTDLLDDENESIFKGIVDAIKTVEKRLDKKSK